MKTLTILFILTSHGLIPETGEKTGVWLEELATPYYAFKDAGYEVEIATIKGGAAPIDPRSQSGDISESVRRFKQDENAMRAIENTPSLAEVDATKYPALFLPGGHGTMWDFAQSEELAQTVSQTLNDKRILASVCHGPAALINATDENGTPIVKGRNIAAFTNQEEEAVGLTQAVPFLLETRLRELGANIDPVDKFQPYAVRDGNLITGQNPASSEPVAMLVIKALGEHE